MAAAQQRLGQIPCNHLKWPVLNLQAASHAQTSTSSCERSAPEAVGSSKYDLIIFGLLGHPIIQSLTPSFFYPALTDQSSQGLQLLRQKSDKWIGRTVVLFSSWSQTSVVLDLGPL